MSASPLQADGNGDTEAIPPSEEVGQIRIGDTAQEQDQDGEGEPPMEQGDPLYAEVKEQDRWLPIANVARIMKIALPDNAKIAKEAKECMQECVSEFISFITSEASEKCQQEKRKTVNGEDILFAMTSLGFENYGEALKIYLSRYRDTHVPKSESHQTKAAAAREAKAAASADPETDAFYQGDQSPTGDVGDDSIYAGLDVKEQRDAKPSQLLPPDEPAVAGASAVDPQFDDPTGPGVLAGDALPSYDV